MIINVDEVSEIIAKQKYIIDLINNGNLKNAKSIVTETTRDLIKIVGANERYIDSILSVLIKG